MYPVTAREQGVLGLTPESRPRSEGRCNTRREMVCRDVVEYGG